MGGLNLTAGAAAPLAIDPGSQTHRGTVASCPVTSKLNGCPPAGRWVSPAPKGAPVLAPVGRTSTHEARRGPQASRPQRCAQCANSQTRGAHDRPRCISGRFKPSSLTHSLRPTTTGLLPACCSALFASVPSPAIGVRAHHHSRTPTLYNLWALAPRGAMAARGCWPLVLLALAAALACCVRAQRGGHCAAVGDPVNVHPPVHAGLACRAPL